MTKIAMSQEKKLSKDEIRYLAKQDIDLQMRRILYLRHEIKEAFDRIKRMKRYLETCK